eukprot:362289-Chlamydomonas_euryale.AAC.9
MRHRTNAEGKKQDEKPSLISSSLPKGLHVGEFMGRPTTMTSVFAAYAIQRLFGGGSAFPACIYEKPVF